MRPRHGCTRHASMHPRRTCRDGWRSERLPQRQRWQRGRRARRPSRRSSPMPTPSTSRRPTSEGIGLLPSAMAYVHYWSRTKPRRPPPRRSTCTSGTRATHRIGPASPISASTCYSWATSSTRGREPSPNTCRGGVGARTPTRRRKTRATTLMWTRRISRAPWTASVRSSRRRPSRLPASSASSRPSRARIRRTN